jgi:hypothetical protein
MVVLLCLKHPPPFYNSFLTYQLCFGLAEDLENSHNPSGNDSRHHAKNASTGFIDVTNDKDDHGNDDPRQ